MYDTGTQQHERSIIGSGQMGQRFLSRHTACMHMGYVFVYGPTAVYNTQHSKAKKKVVARDLPLKQHFDTGLSIYQSYIHSSISSTLQIFSALRYHRYFVSLFSLFDDHGLPEYKIWRRANHSVSYHIPGHA